MKDIIVQKYGGSSVSSIEKIKNVAKKIVDVKNRGLDVIVVVSAMGDTTDELMDKAKQLSDYPSSRELDMLLSSGEQISSSLLSMAIQALGHASISLTGSQCGIFTDNNHKNARIQQINTDRILKELSSENIVIVAGFQGINNYGDITTLGRGGSDTSAVALAAAVNARACEIYTDVNGVYTTDPRLVPSAKLINKISYDEMLELANLGAKVLHPRAVEVARKYNIHLAVKSSFNNDNGTEIMEVDAMENAIVRGITLDENMAKISVIEVPDKPGIAYKLFSRLSSNNIHVDMIIQNISRDKVNDISFTVCKDDLQDTLRVVKMVANEIGAKEIIYDDSVVKLSVVGTGISGSPDIASAYFEAIYNLGINIQMINTSEIKMSCIINREKAITALKYLHNKFKLDAAEVNSKKAV